MNPSSDDKLQEECGVFGIFGHAEAATLTTLGLHALQHRGQEAAGIVSYDGQSFYSERHAGLVGDNFTNQDVINRLVGKRAIGHVRYSTAGDNNVIHDTQPLFAEFAGGGFAVAHNGNLTNTKTLKKQLQKRGSIFQSTADTETIIHLIATSSKSKLVERLVDALKQVEGAYSLVALSDKKMIGVRDPLGIRPLVLGSIDGAYVLASETCAFDIIGAQYIRDIQPGEMLVITEDGMTSSKPFSCNSSSRFCIFEYVYFSRPDSMIEGRSIYSVRKQIGAELARESAVQADVVVPVPDSGTPAAIGYAEAAGIPFDLGIIRNHYVGRTFIEPTDSIRHMGVKLKHNANQNVLKGKRVVLVDDSIVRGTTSLKIVQMVRDAGASEVHMCIASPPTSNSCYYGVDTPEKSKLIASHMSVDEIRDYIQVDSLNFLSIDGLYRAVGIAKRDHECPQFCDACFTGDYPTALTDLKITHHISRQLNLLSEAV